MGITTKTMLALVIVLGLAGIVLGLTYVPGKYQAKIDEAKKEADEKVSKANKDLATSKAKLEKSELDLASANSELATANTEKTKLKSENDTLKIDLADANKQLLAIKQKIDDAEKQRDDAIKQLAVYQDYKLKLDEFLAIGLPINVIKKQLDDHKKCNPPPPPITGTIRNVDPKFGFVTIDIGATKGVKAAGLMTVTRNGKFVGQIKVRIVQPSLSIADVVKDMTKEELKEGDVVAVTNF